MYLDCEAERAKQNYLELRDKYPIVMTRNIDKAKDWLKEKQRGTERVGLVAYSGGQRLRPYGIHVKSKIEPKHWFLNDKNDIRSSFYLEEVATEFDIQGLELDWVCMVWGSSLRFEDKKWIYKSFKGTKWQNINDETRRLYLKNAYRVLLTRARQGMIIFIPEGDELDQTNLPAYHNSTFRYLSEVGIEEI